MARAKYAGVTQRADGAWMYRIKRKINGESVDIIRSRDADGKPFLTARAAYDAKMRHEQELETHTPQKRKPKTTLAQIYQTYLESADGKSKAPATLRKQDSMWRCHLQPAFGSRDINSIKLPEWEDYLYNMYQRYAYRFVEGNLKFVYLLNAVAHKNELIDPERYYSMFVDRDTRLSMPKKSQADVEEDMQGVEVYSDYDLSEIRRVLSSEGGNLLVSYYIAIYTGVRISECFALRWSDIDWSKRSIRVSRQMHYQHSRLELCAVKTMTAIRDIPLPRTLAEYLLQYYEEQVANRKKLGQAYRDGERVYDAVKKEWIVGGDFIQRKSNGEILTVNSVKYWAQKIKQQTGINFHFHSLRHTFASNCAMSNINIMLLMSWMGHRKVDTTKKYYINIDNKTMLDKAIRVVDGMYNLNVPPEENVWAPGADERRFSELSSEAALLKLGITIRKD